MSNGTSCVAPCGSNTCFPIFQGKRVASANLPNEFDVCHVLRCTDGRLFRRQRTSNGTTWAAVNLPSNCPFIFLDVYNDVVCLINFGQVNACQNPFSPVTPINPVTPVAPVSPTNGGGVVGPIVETSANGSLTATTSAPGTSPSLAVTGTAASTAAGAVTSGNSLTVTAVPAGTPLAASPSVSAPLGATVVASGVGNGGNLDLVVLSNGSAVIRSPGEEAETNGTITHGRLRNNSRAIVSDNGAYAQFVASNNSVVHSDQDGGHAGGTASECSLLHAASASSMARGTAIDRSEVRTGGMPRLKNLPRNSRFTVAQVGVAVNAPDVNTVQAITFDSDTGCANRTVFVQDTSNPLQPPLGFFGSKITLGSIGIENAPGVGHGAMTTGLSATQSSLLATANGALAAGTAECGEVHQAVGKGSTVFGRGNTALGAYSQAIGHNSLAYMHGHFAQAIKTSVNDDVPQGADRVQYNMVPLRGFTTCERILSSDRLTVTGFRLTTILVLGDTPDNAVIDIENGPTLDFRRVPFLPFNGTAMVEADVVSPRLIPDEGDPIPGFCGKFCFCVTRVGSDNQIRHEIENGGPGNTLGVLCQIPTMSSLGLTITAIARTGNSAGFTIQIVEDLPLTVQVGTSTIPNPRIDPAPPIPFPATNQTNFVLQGRVWGGHFRYTEVPAGSSEVKCEAPNEDRVTVVAGTPAVSVASVPGACRGCGCVEKGEQVSAFTVSNGAGVTSSSLLSAGINIGATGSQFAVSSNESAFNAATGATAFSLGGIGGGNGASFSASPLGDLQVGASTSFLPTPQTAASFF